MLKKLFITAAATAAVSVPLAGTAWATPSDTPNNPPGHPQSTNTKPGIPGEAGATLDAISAANPTQPNLNTNGTGNPISPGQVFNAAKDQYPGVNTPTAVEAYVDNAYSAYLGVQGSNFAADGLPPGLTVKSFTPGCKSGNTAASGPVGPGVCN
ncbi:hypothetical protein Mycch_1093 [Mycolicibacterium chubuense NBB4]|uniref:Low molecular weight antigen MTB12 n=1 Tax=Mycolicibacterium chubuense (strain NBB4) TaxID=710421 RepID=I4BF45_MYCCN|nr:hypothetical protein Mycch_1093 [Mycolicibacterium chubuense NBB4]